MEATIFIFGPIIILLFAAVVRIWEPISATKFSLRLSCFSFYIRGEGRRARIPLSRGAAASPSGLSTAAIPSKAIHIPMPMMIAAPTMR